ncbi:hypothetical protein [Sphingomonas abietis]|uniref:DUF2147 domain-containing protein n=1 Tax=Sphingomonas abietis TaxID=3012344 RepID=A0ABY7NLC9_9SPHN|nr:hypothetical protein [Sphingomonas abietis]WBO22158.1 hypothetical protein PBT88_18715 [Sphingomonas abietis]
MRPAFFVLLGVAGLAAAGPAPARDPAPRDLGSWTVAPSTDGKGCFLTRSYDGNGGTTLLLGLDVDGANRLSVLNANWSIKAKQALKLNFRLSNSSYPDHFAVGIVSDGQQGFVTSFGMKFPSYVATSKDLRISRGDVPVGRWDLDGAAAAVAALEHCVGDLQVDPAAAPHGNAPHRKKSSDGIPSDPFAPAPHGRNQP